MTKNGLIVGLFVVMMVLAALALTQFNAQQDAAAQARDAQTAQAEVLAAQATSIAQADAAQAAQQTAEAGQGTAVALAAAAALAQGEAEAGRETAVAQANAAEDELTVREAEFAAIQTRVAADATVQAQNGTAVGVAAATITAQASDLRSLAAALGTATAQVDRADLARSAAEDDRAIALEQASLAATLLAQAQATMAVLQPAALNETPTQTVLINAVTATPSLVPTVPMNTVTATPVLTGVPVVADEVSLDQTFVTADGTIQLNYPDGWLVQESNSQIFLVNTADALANGDSPIQSGHFLANIIFGSTSDLPETAADAGAVEFLTTLTGVINARATAAEQLGEVTATTAGDYQAARAQGQIPNGQTLVIAVRLGGGVFAVGFGNSAPGEVDQHEAVFLAILGTLTAATAP